MRVLFLCRGNRLRSPTAEQVFSTWPGIEVESAGLSRDAVTPVSSELVEWAELIFVMEAAHRVKLSKKFGGYLKQQRVICLGIPIGSRSCSPSYREPARREGRPILAARCGASAARAISRRVCSAATFTRRRWGDRASLGNVKLDVAALRVGRCHSTSQRRLVGSKLACFKYCLLRSR